MSAGGGVLVERFNGWVSEEEEDWPWVTGWLLTGLLPARAILRWGFLVAAADDAEEPVLGRGDAWVGATGTGMCLWPDGDHDDDDPAPGDEGGMLLVWAGWGTHTTSDSWLVDPPDTGRCRSRIRFASHWFLCSLSLAPGMLTGRDRVEARTLLPAL